VKKKQVKIDVVFSCPHAKSAKKELKYQERVFGLIGVEYAEEQYAKNITIS